MRILIADDHPVIRNGIKQIILEHSSSIQVEEAENTNDAIQKALHTNFNLIIMDISMHGGGGLHALSRIISLRPSSKIIMLSVFSDEQYILRAIKLGAYGYLTKTSATEELNTAISKVLSGEKYFSTEVAQKMTLLINNDYEKSKHENLSDREFQVFCMIAQGKSINEIADEVCLSPKTISTHYYRLLNKMGMKKNSDIIHYALKNKLIEV